MLELVEEALDDAPVAIQEAAEGGRIDPTRHRFDVRPSTTGHHRLAQGIAVVSAVREQNLPGQHLVEHVGCAAAVVRLTFGKLDRDRQAVGISRRLLEPRFDKQTLPDRAADSLASAVPVRNKEPVGR